MKKHVKLTLAQAQLLHWACEAGLDQHEKFLRHDDWDIDMSAKEKRECTWYDRRFKRAIQTIRKAIAKAE